MQSPNPRFVSKPLPSRNSKLSLHPSYAVLQVGCPRDCQIHKVTKREALRTFIQCYANYYTAPNTMVTTTRGYILRLHKIRSLWFSQPARMLQFYFINRISLYRSGIYKYLDIIHFEVSKMFQRGNNESLGNEESSNYLCALHCEDHEQQYKIEHSFQDN